MTEARDPWARARIATAGMEKHLAAIAALADERALALRDLLEQGYTRAEIARRLGVTPAVVTKILKRPVHPARRRRAAVTFSETAS